MKISSNLEDLDKLNEKYNWIPSSKNIRPSEEILKRKNEELEVVNFYYQSFKDYIFDTVFGLPININDNGKLFCNFTLNLVTLEENKFPYMLPDNTKHYVLWYSNKENINDEIIMSDIKKQIVRMMGHDNYEFVWYENPKINKDFYHVHVFIHNI